MTDILELKGMQLAYARSIALIKLEFPPVSSAFDDHDPEYVAYEKAESICRQLAKAAGLSSQHGWMQKVPLIDLYDFTETERALLLDLDDAGGVQITRKMDGRFNRLGCGSGGKGAVAESASERWKVQLTKRGEALVAAFKEEGNDKP